MEIQLNGCSYGTSGGKPTVRLYFSYLSAEGARLNDSFILIPDHPITLEELTEAVIKHMEALGSITRNMQTVIGSMNTIMEIPFTAPSVGLSPEAITKGHAQQNISALCAQMMASLEPAPEAENVQD